MVLKKKIFLFVELIQAKAKLLPMFHKKKRKSKKIIEDSDVSVDTDYEDF